MATPEAKKLSPDTHKVLAQVIPLLETAREQVPMIFAFKDCEEAMTCRDLLRQINVLLGGNLEDEVSVIGLFDSMVKLGNQKTWGPAFVEMVQVIPPRPYTKRTKTDGTVAPAAEQNGEETTEEETTESTVEDSAAESSPEATPAE